MTLISLMDNTGIDRPKLAHECNTSTLAELTHCTPPDTLPAVLTYVPTVAASSSHEACEART